MVETLVKEVTVCGAGVRSDNITRLHKPNLNETLKLLYTNDNECTMKLLSLINCILGVFFIGMMIPVFRHLTQGEIWAEPNQLWAGVEALLACVIVLFYAAQLPYWFIKAIQNKG